MAIQHPVQRILELAEGIYIETAIPRENHPAVRSGFAGYPSNPRWNVRKHQAWKQGRQWRQALDQGVMVVEKQRLIPKVESADTATATPTPVKVSERSLLKNLAFSWN